MSRLTASFCRQSTPWPAASLQPWCRAGPLHPAPPLPHPCACLRCASPAVGDIHGDLQKALACLEMAGVLAEDDGHIRWVGGDTVVVQLGDVLDRGDCEIGEPCWVLTVTLCGLSKLRGLKRCF